MILRYDHGMNTHTDTNVKIIENAARAVIDLTAKVERVEALAKGLDHEADMIEAEGSDGVEAYVDAARSDAYRIRKALNGDDR